MVEPETSMDDGLGDFVSATEPEGELHQKSHDRFTPPELGQLALWWDPNEAPPEYPIVSGR